MSISLASTVDSGTGPEEREREREKKRTTHRRTNCKENVTGATYCVLSKCGRLKRSLGDNKKTNPVREVYGREKSLWQ